VLNFSLAAQNINEYFEHIRNNEAELTAFISQMPKGGDLHNHYSGAVYAESYINWVIEKDFWIDTQTLAVTPDVKAPGTWTKFSALSSQGKLDLYKQKLLQLWSTKDYYQTEDGGPEQHFFNTFPAFSPASSINYDSGLLELKRRAIAENVSYIELMLSRVNFPPKKINSADYNITLGQIQSRHDSLELRSVLASLYDSVMKVPIQDSVKSFIRFVHSLHDSLNIDTANFTMRYQTYIARTADAVTTFKNLVASFEAANRDSLIVGVNIVAPEDNPVSMRDYWLHMQMFAFCHQKYKSVKYSMHAGELAEGYVKPEELTWHIDEAVRVAGARRIGHGVDIGYEKNNYELLNYMRKHNVAVEINLSSNEFILGIKNDAHPITLYKRFHVPLVISTDDAGVNRSSLTEQYVLLASRYKNITYGDIKTFVYNSITYSFLDDAKKQALKKDLDERFKRFENYVMTQQP
ncbi:MAG TPA: hypothetical protein VEV83_07515, partial [Parafilimonas sp.]|nr:hypothetical protein [Parafilimonas sp.]